jgi:hypothetical protein
MNSTPSTDTPAPSPAADPQPIDGDLLLRGLRHPSGAAGWILQHRQGQLQSELTEALAAVLLACSDTTKPGEITLKVRVQPNPDMPGQMLLSDRVLIKLPPRANACPYLFDQDAMRLAGELPGQLSIPLAS